MLKVTSEREGWLAIAEAWDKAKAIIPNSHEVCARFGSSQNTEPFGLCYSLYFIEPRDIRHDMRARLEKELEKLGCKGVYHWPRTIEGAKERAYFCRKMAELCEKEQSNG